MRFQLFMLFALFALPALADVYTLQTDSTVDPPATITINVLTTNNQSIYGIEFTIADTPEKAVFSKVETTVRSTGALVTSYAQGADKTKIAMVLSGTGSGISTGTGNIL